MKEIQAYLKSPLAAALAASLVAAALALVVRLYVIEVHEIGQLCDPGTGPWWCGARQATYQAFRIWQPIGIGALGAAALLSGIGALVQGGRWASGVAAFIGGLGCVLYNADLAALGLVLALVAAARMGRPLSDQR
jgi:hypothetical protein